MIRVNGFKRSFAAMIAVMIICGLMIPVISIEVSAAETSLSSRAWKSSMTEVLDSRNGDDYHSAGMCTGYVAWAIRNADLYDVGSWPKNGFVADFEEELKDRGVSRVSKSQARAGDIVIFGDTHIAIMGEDGMLHHNTTSRGIRSHEETIDQWLEWGGEKTGDVRIYRGFSQKVKISIVKKSYDADQTDGNRSYSLKGAVYGLYSKGSSSPVATLTTDADGKASVTVSQGDYILKEITAPKGYEIDDTEYAVKADDNVTKTVYDVPQGQIIEFAAYKTDEEIHEKWGGDILPQGEASLAGAQFTVKYFKDYHNENELEGADPARTWIIETDDKGRAVMDDDHLVSGDKLYKNKNGDTVIPLGTVSIQETGAPDGYKVNDTLYVYQIRAESSGDTISSFVIPTVPQEIIRGGVQIQKWDKELGASEALGGAEYGQASTGTSLADIDFIITNVSENAVKVDGKIYAQGDKIMTLTTAWNESAGAYTAQTSEDFLPYGIYEIREAETNKSYLLTDGKPRIFEIRNDNEIVSADIDDDILVFKNQVIRGDLSFVKVNDSTMKRLAGIPFALINQTTGESHVLVTDINGYASTESEWNRHTESTNANDHLMYGSSGEEPDDSAGIWFGRGEFGSVAEADDSRGALPYGKYILNEISCSANEGRKLLSDIEISVYKDKVNIDMGTLINEIDEEPDEPVVPGSPDEPDKPDSTDEKSPKTGDNVPYYIIIAMTVMMIAAAAAGMILICRKNMD